MKEFRTIIFQHLHRTGGTTVYSIMKRYFNPDAIYWIDGLRNGERYSVELFLSLPQPVRDKIALLRGHLPFGLHNQFSHPCDYITVIRDPVERIISEYAKLVTWRDLKHIKNSKKIKGISLKEFAESDLAAVNDYQTRVLSGHWVGHYESIQPLSADALEEARRNLKNYFRVVGVTDKLDETILVLAKIFGWKNPFYLERKQVAGRVGIVPQEELPAIQEIIRSKNRLDAELHQYATELLSSFIKDYGPCFERDLRWFRRKNYFLSRAIGIGKAFPVFLRNPVKNIMRFNR